LPHTFYIGSNENLRGGNVKERLKRFYKKNETSIVGTTYIVTAIVVAALTTRKIVEGMQINDVMRRMYEDGTMDLAICLKNGNVQNFHWLPTAE
jgi:hypothetical protein